MTLLEEALAHIQDPKAKVVGLWLATQSGIPSIGPQQGMLLTKIAQEVKDRVKAETNSVIQADLNRFIMALDFICQVAAIHQAAAIDHVQRLMTGGKP